MLAFRPSPQAQKSLTPNLLPCKIHHDGPIPISKRHWDPQPESRKKQKKEAEADAEAETPPTSSPSHDAEPKTQTAYFRGRKLLGKTLTLPEGYEGVIAQRTEEVFVPSAQSQAGKGVVLGLGRGMRHEEDGDDGEDDEEEEEEDAAQAIETKYMERIAGFEEMIVWGHDLVPGDEDGYVKGLEEWVGFAERIHAYDETGSSASA